MSNIENNKKAEAGQRKKLEPSFENGTEDIKTRGEIKVVVFKLADHEHAVDVRRVREILLAPNVSPVVEAPDFVDGVIKHRGRIIPIVNLRKRLHLPTAEKTLQTCIILVRSGKRMVGWVVDTASELLRVPIGQIEAPTELVGGIRARFIEGVVYLGDRFLVILKLDEILNINERAALDSVSVPCEETSNPEESALKSVE